MNYRLDKYGNKISILGFGCMRFQKTMGKINMEEMGIDALCIPGHKGV